MQYEGISVDGRKKKKLGESPGQVLNCQVSTSFLFLLQLTLDTGWTTIQDGRGRVQT